MAFITPNATDTTSGNRYAALDQAEPDALDLEILGNDLTGTVTGCVVTSNGSNSTVSVSGGVVVIGGATYTVTANPTLALPAPPADNRFDLVVARKYGTYAILTVVSGPNSSDNPVFPRSVNVLDSGTAYNPNAHIDLNNETVLAALYRQGSQAVTDSHIVDKRVIRSVSILLKGSGPPGSGVGVPGSLYQDTSVSPLLNSSTTTASGVYVKASATEWIPLARDLGPHLPIGACIGWPTDADLPVGCVEANNQLLPVSAYPALFAVYGYKWGGSGASFRMPPYNEDRYLRGTTNLTTLFTTLGSDSATISVANLPIHSHTMAHTHSLNSHTHDFAHYHTGFSSQAGSHRHEAGGENLFVHQRQSDGNLTISSGSNNIYRQGGMDFAGQHSHTITISPLNNTVNTAGSGTQTGTPSNNNTGASSASTTGNTGSGTALDIRPKTAHVRWIIKASMA